MATCNVVDNDLQVGLEAPEERVQAKEVQDIDPETSVASNRWQIARAASKLRHGVGIAVRKGVGMLRSKQVNSRKELELEEEFKPDFLSTCEAFDKRLRVLCSKHKLSNITRDLDKTGERFKEKQILISFLGCYNTGKSTLLNALLKARLLPMKELAETSAQVLIQHIRNDLPLVQSTTTTTCENKEPMLEVTNVDDIEVVSCGVEDIYKQLQTLNHDVRSGRQGHVVVPECTLTTCVPFLADAPSEWRVSLVDTPGFGESDGHVEMLATEALKSSSAYVYITTYRTLHAQTNTNYLRFILAHDKGVFQGNRLIIVITQYDQVSGSAELSDTDEEITEEEVKKQTCQFVHKACPGIKFSPDDVLLVSGRWAYHARMLAVTPPHGTTQSAYDKCQGIVKRLLRDVPNSACGQGEDPTVSFDKLGGDELSAKLEDASGIATLEARIKTMTKSCVNIWVEKMKGDYERYNTKVVNEMSQASNNLSECIECDQQQLMSKLYYLASIVGLRKELKDNPQVNEEITKSYPIDLQHSKPQHFGKMEVRELVAAFHFQCVEKVRDKKTEFGPRQLESDIKDFLEESTKALDEIFSSTCTFPRMHKVLMRHVCEMGVKVERMRTYAQFLSPGKAKTLLSKTVPDEEEATIGSSELLRRLELIQPLGQPEPLEVRKTLEPPKLLEPPKPSEPLEPAEPQTPKALELPKPLEPPEILELAEILEPLETSEQLEPLKTMELLETLEPLDPVESVERMETPVPLESPGKQELLQTLEPIETPVPLELLETPELLQPLEPPSLGDLKEKVKIPSVSLSVWSKFMHFCSEHVSSFLSFWRRVLRTEITEQHSVNPSGQSSINASPKSSGDNIGNSNNTSATQASGNEIGNSIHDSSSAALSSENNIENSIDKSQNAAQPNEYYRKWNDELDETIKALQEFLENQCDTYFVNIKERTVKYFYDQYRRETRTRLASFDAEFKEGIDKQRKELKKLKKRIDDNHSELMELKRMSAHLNNLAIHLSRKARDYQRKWT